MRERVKGWPGYVHRQQNGESLFIIERQITVDGKRHRFHLSTGCHSIKPALDQLARFEADPFSYSRAGGDLRAPLLLTAELAVKFFDVQREKGLSLKYVRETNTSLLKWVVHMRGKDLRRLKLARDVLPALDASGGNRRPMMAALKTFMTWLRVERHEITSAEDVSRDLRLPQSDPAKRRKEVTHDKRSVAKVLRRLEGVYRDALLFQWATTAHVAELERFVRDPRSKLVVFGKPQRLPDGTKALAVASYWHKSSRKTGDLHDVALTRPEEVKAAQRLRERGSIPSQNKLNRVIYAACDAAGVPRMSFVMRHTGLSRAASRGISEDRRMKHAGHQNAATARRYVQVKLPLAAIPAEKL